MSNTSDPREDPLGLDAVDREIRLSKLRQQAEEGGEGHMFISKDCPPELEEQFLEGMLRYDAAPIGTRFKQLENAGVELPAPDSLDDQSLHAKLWEVIGALAKFDVSLHHTDHLSDRQLYEVLWSDLLREEVAIMPPGSGWMGSIDIIGGGSEEDIQISLRYYDDEDRRSWWAKDFPNDVIPPHEDLPYDRDRRLPRVEPPQTEFDGEHAD